MAGIYGLIDQLDESVNTLGTIEQRVGRRAVAPVATYLPERVNFGSPEDWWTALKGWITSLPEWVGPLADLYAKLVQSGIITPTQAYQAQQAGLTREEVLELIKAMQPKPFWESPWFPVTLGIGIVGAASLYYVAKKAK